VLSAFGVFASVVTLLTSLGNLLFPGYANIIQFGWAPIFIAEIVTGIWLWARGVKIEPCAESRTSNAFPGTPTIQSLDSR
jgi:hypothetical protein